MMKNNCEKLKSLNDKTLSNEEHATTSLLSPHIFPAETLYCSTLPKKGFRVSLQLQFEKRRGIFCPIAPAQVIASVLHDHEDPLFDQLEYMIALTLRKAHHKKQNKRSFNAIGCKANWHNLEESNKKKNSAHHCIQVLKQSCKTLKQKGQDSRSFAKYLLFDWMNDEDTSIDLRMVYVDVEHEFGPHRSTGNRERSNKSLTAHANSWVLHDCVPGNDNCGPWTKHVYSKTISYEEGSTIGRFGEIECAFNKSFCTFHSENNFPNEGKLISNIVLRNQ